MNLTSPDGLRPAVPGYDHAWFPWSPRTSRPARTLPGGALLAVSVVLDLGAVEWERPATVVPPPGGRGIAPYPDLPRMSHREFGHRVGVFRLLRICQEAEVPVAAAVDVLTAEHYGRLVEQLAPVVGEFLAAGLSASRPITSAMSDDEERHYLTDALGRLRAALPSEPVGWLGAARGESARTPRLLAEAGLRYVADWCNDDQPYRMDGAGELWAFPLSWELSDLAATFDRQVLPWIYADSIGDAVDVLLAEGGRSAPVLGLHLHPWLSGQAFRASAVAGLLRRLRSDERIWLATPGEIVDWYASPA
jgi:allantoinase